MTRRRETQGKQHGPRGSPAFKGYQKVLVSLAPEQAAALKREALRCALQSGTARPDASAIVREALEARLSRKTRGARSRPPR